MSPLDYGSPFKTRLRVSGPIRAAAAAIAALIGGSAPCLVFWFLVRGADAAYPASSEALVLVASPLIAAFVFALLGPRPVLRWSAVFAAAFAVPLALLTILAVYRGDLEGLGPAPLAVIAAWVLCWVVGFVGVATGSRVRSWAATAHSTSLSQSLREWWGRRTCHHDWELVEKNEMLGRWGRGVGYHHLCTYRCRSCGAVRVESDRWGPV
jgi:hypothetical protein